MLVHDIRFAWRMTVQRPAFTAVAILILGLGIGANATIFSWVQTTLLEPMPGVAEQNRLVALRGTLPTRPDLSFSYLNFLDLQTARPPGLEDIIAFRGLAMSLRADGEPTRVWGELVTPNFFTVLRVSPVLGRTFVPSDSAAIGREPVAVISHALWRRLFNADPGVVGRAVTLNGQAFTVVGVAQEGFRGSLVGLTLDVFVPITMQQAVLGGNRLPERGNSFLQVVGRLAAGASIAQAQASASAVAARLAKEYPDANKDRGIRVIPLWKDGTSALMLPVMALLMGVVGVVLLIACANLAGLLLARVSGRQREIAVRLAVGASRGRLVRQFLVESLLLAVGGGAAGLVLSYWTSGMLNTFLPPTPLPIGFSAGVSATVVLFLVLVTSVAAALFGLVPAFRASRPDVASTLKDAASHATAGARRGRLRQALVVSQVALSLILIGCAALFGRSLQQAQLVDPGFSIRHGVIASLDLLSNGYDEARGTLFVREMLQRLSTVPEVEAASVGTSLPLDLGPSSDMGFSVEGYHAREGELLTAYYSRVGPRFFETMGIPIVSGRALDDRDADGRELSVVINETMARRYFTGRDPVGATVKLGNRSARVVGVAKDGKYGRLNEEPRNYVYFSILQFYRPDPVLVVRTSADPAQVASAVKAEIRRLDPNLPMFDVRTVEEHLQFSLFIPRMASTLLGVFGGLALLLAAVGLYSVIAFSVAQRTREIGIRMALGAHRGDVLRMVVGQGLLLTAIGLVIGVALTAAVSRLIAGQLIGVTGSDPVSWVATVGMLVGVSLAACVLPARRAASLDPLKALRCE
jgi:macrolide transport system ATP-binding/permease protein